MTNPTYDNIFELYYTMYRMEATIPDSTDDEYTIGKILADEAIARWANYDGTYWKDLFTTAQTNGTGAVLTLTTGTQDYAAPTAMAEAGGYIKVLDAGVTIRRIPIIDPQEAQFRSDESSYCYFTGSRGAGYTLHLNTTVDASLNGKTLDYVYYKKPTKMTTGATITECPNAEYVAHRMLYMRFRGSRNPFVTSAKSDAEDALRTMKMDNDSGTWANPWKLADNSGAQFGAGSGSRIF